MSASRKRDTRNAWGDLMKASLAVLAVLLASVPALAAEPQYVELLDTTAELSGQGLTVRLAVMNPTDPDRLYRVPYMTVSEGKQEAIEITGVASGFEHPGAYAWIAEFDPANDSAEVLFSTFTGGAHCCDDIRIADKGADGTWREIEFGQFDGGVQVQDPDGDGTYEITTVDQSFLYAFDCFACSASPLQIWAIRDGEMVNVTFEPQYRQSHEEWLLQLEDNGTGAETTLGFLGGWVAERVILGEGEAAWADMLRLYDPAVDPGFPVCTIPGVSPYDCPEKATVTLTFPDALARHLAENGYPVPPNATPAVG